MARARGLTDGRILTAYVGRNATLPLFTRLAISVGFVVGGSVLLETLFTYRGVGFLLARSISERDYPVMQGVFLIITVVGGLCEPVGRLRVRLARSARPHRGRGKLR